MKKRSITTLLLSLAAFFAQAQQTMVVMQTEPAGQRGPAGLPFTIEGIVTRQQKPIKAILTIRGDSRMIGVDSTDVRQGRFTFKGVIPEPVQAFISFIRPGGNVRPMDDRLDLFLDSKGTITVATTDSISKATVRGSPAQAAYEALNGELKGLYDQQATLMKQYGALSARKDLDGLKALQDRMNEWRAAMHRVNVAYVKHNPASPIDIWVLKNFGAYYLDVAEVGPLYDNLSPDLKATPSGKELGDRLTAFRRTAVGQQAMDFSQPDTSGKIISLASYKGKYVLVDFWASWCHVCRQENPYVLNAYNTYKDRGFTVLTISLDTDKARWKEAFNKDGMIWTTVSDLQGQQNAVAVQYGISGIPKSVLIDPSGKIIAKNLRGDDLNKKLEEIFAGK